MSRDLQHKDPRAPDAPTTEEDVEHQEPPPQTWKHPDDGKSLSDRDEERPLKP